MKQIKKIFSKILFFREKKIFDFKVKDIYGHNLDLSTFKGKKILLVNIASKCGLTPQIELLEKLYKKYNNEDFHIIGVPSNDFGNQEPLNNDEIISFCEKNYNVTFTILQKSKVLGTDIHPIYEMLKKKNHVPEWNFHKYLFDINGLLLCDFEPGTSPMEEKLIKHLES